MTKLSITTIEISDSVIWQELQGEAVLLNMDDQSYFSLDDVGATMWQSLVLYRNLEHCTEHLQRIYQADSTTIRSDLQKFVIDLIFAGLVRATAG